MSRRYCYRELLPFAAMVARECCNVGTKVLFKAASLEGMSFYVYLTYSLVLANFAILPFVFIFPSPAVLPTSKFPLVSRICLLGLIGFFGLFVGIKGVEYSSPTLSSAMSNLTPVFTFILAIIFRMERVALRRSSSQAKIVGTIVSISGALMVILYKGATVFSSSSPISLQLALTSSLSNWLIGGLMLAAEYLLVSLFYIVLTQVMEIYPAKFMVTLLLNLCATILCIPVCLMIEPNLRRWILKSSVQIAAIFSLGFITISTVVDAWCVHLKGPVYVTSFKPLSFPIAAAMSALLLGDALHLGSVIGAIIISIGFYAVLWGKAKEDETSDDSNSKLLVTSSSEYQVPLLHDYIVEDGERIEAGK